MGKTKLSKVDIQLINDFCKNMPIYPKRYTSGPKKGEFMMAKNNKSEMVNVLTDPLKYMIGIAINKGCSELPVYYRKYLDEYKIVSELLIKKNCEKAGVKYAKPKDVSENPEP